LISRLFITQFDNFLGFFYGVVNSVAEPHVAAPAPGENFDAAPAPAPIQLYSKAKFFQLTDVYTHVETILFL
jgi:hypothetical protein